MPKVVTPNGETRHFPYTEDGLRRARIFAKNTGGRLVHSTKSKPAKAKQPKKPTKGY